MLIEIDAKEKVYLLIDNVIQNTNAKILGFLTRATIIIIIL
jgi:hypothetical protein